MSQSDKFEPTAETKKHLDGERSSAAIKTAILIAVVAIGSIAYFGAGVFRKPTPAPQTTMVDADEIAKRVPVQDLTLTDAEGHQKMLSQYKGKVVILSFWASWCAPCLDELPTFGQLSKKLAGRGLQILPINVDEGDEGKEFAKKFWATQKFDMPSFFDTTKSLASQFQVEMLPANFVIDRAGRMAFSGFGANDWTNPETVEFLDGLLAEGEKTN